MAETRGRVFMISNSNINPNVITKINQSVTLSANDIVFRFDMADKNSNQVFDGRTTDHVYRTKGTGFHGMSDKSTSDSKLKPLNGEKIRSRFIVWNPEPQHNIERMHRYIEVHNLESSNEQNILIDGYSGSPPSELIVLEYLVNNYDKHDIIVVGSNCKNPNFLKLLERPNVSQLPSVKQVDNSTKTANPATAPINKINPGTPHTVLEEIFDENPEYPIFANIYTVDNGYEKYAKSLIESLKQFKLSYYIEGYQTNGRKWNEITKYKPFILKRVLDKYPDRPVVWIDADATVEKMPVLFPNIKKDFAVHYFNGNELGSGLVFFANTQTSRNILDDWIIENDKNMVTWDQVHLSRVINRKYKHVVERLPKEYCCIFDKKGYSNLDRVIAQWQASRKLKRN